MANRIFISYRRSDTSGEAGHLAESLEQLLGTACAFRDADDIRPGEDFEVVLKRELAGTETVVVLIGRKWLAELSARLSRPAPDFVRIEIATALHLGKVVIPVLLNGAELPAADALPDDLRQLVRHQALNLRDEAWTHDTGRLADTIGRPYAWRHVVLRAVLAVPAAVIAAKYAVGTLAPDAVNQLALARSVVLGLLALYICVEVAWWWRQRRRKAPGTN
jgi:hypothetical protein